jgi:hypothetical protein
MKKIFLYHIWLAIFIIMFINGNSQIIIPRIDSSSSNFFLPQQVNAYNGVIHESYLINEMPLKNEIFIMEPMDEGCGTEYESNTVSYPAFGITNEPSPDRSVGIGSEVSVSVDPTNKCILRGCDMETAGGQIYYYFSNDGGQSWSSDNSLIPSHSDPTVVINSTGTCFVSYLMDHEADGLNEAYVAIGLYHENTNNFIGRGEVYGPIDQRCLDKPHLCVDNSPVSQYKGNLYCAWQNRFYGTVQSSTDCQIDITKSENNGLNWYYNAYNPISDPALYTNHSSYNNGVNIQTGPGGEVYVVWVVSERFTSGLNPESGLVFNRSLDGGITYDGLSGLQTSLPGVKIQDIHGIAAMNSSVFFDVTLNSFPSMCVDKSGGPHNGTIYIVWANQAYMSGSPFNRIDVFIISSPDKGITWTTPVQVNQSSPYTSQVETHAFFPWISCDDESGVISVIFYDDSQTGYDLVETHVAMSKDYGNTWNEWRVSDNKFMPPSTGWFGDYIGICSKDGLVYPTFTDTYSNCYPSVVVSPFDMWPCAEYYNNILGNGEEIAANQIKKWQAQDYIIAMNQIEQEGMAVFTAGNEIIFKPILNNGQPGDPYGFWAQSGSFVHAYIGGCASCNSKDQRDLTILSQEPDNNKLKVSVFPNPSDGKFQIDFKEIEIHGCRLEITNSVGTPVYSRNMLDQTTLNIDISNYPKGIYLIKLYSKDRTYVNKMVCK